MSEINAATVKAAEAEMSANAISQSAQAAPVSTETQSSPAESEPEPQNKDTATGSSTGSWPEVHADAPLAKFIDRVAKIVKEAGYDEVFGIHLGGESEFGRNLILQKFLRANANDIEKAATQLQGTLKWRKEFQPLSLPKQSFSKEKFGGLAYISKLANVPESTNKTDVCCWNIYGSVTDNKVTFGDLDAFTKWRVAVMEAALATLNLSKATEPIPNYGEGPDPYQMIQVHDYKNVSFLRQDPDQKAAAKKAIEIFGAHYPETLSRKMFINVPTIMGWMFTAMKMVLSRETVRKFTVISDGKYLVGELGDSVPEEYGGKGSGLESAEELKME